MRDRRAWVALFVVLTLVAACSDDPSDDDGAASSEVTSPAPDDTAAGTTVVPDPTSRPPVTTAGAPVTSVPAPPPPNPAIPATSSQPVTTTALASAYPGQPAGIPFPTLDWSVGTLPAGVDPAVIDAAVDVAFGSPDAEARVRSIVVVKGGQIVYERYHPLDGPDVVYDSYSVAKSFTSALVGMLVADGTLSLDEHPPRPEWALPGDPRQAITLRQLLQMSSGLEWTEEYGPGSVAAEMSVAPDAAAVMAAQPLEADPGTVFEYSTGTTALIAGIATDALGGCEAGIAYVNERLLDPIGITTDQLLTDGNGCWLGGYGANMTTRDFARFGLLYLRGGLWEGRPIVPTSWIDESRTPAATNPIYGLQWWLRPDGRAFSAEGLFGQRIVVVPEADLVVAVNTSIGGDPFTLVDAVLGAFGIPPA